MVSRRSTRWLATVFSGGSVLASALALAGCSAPEDAEDMGSFSASVAEDDVEGRREEGSTISQRAPGDDPYQGISHLRNEALKSALYNLIKNHRSLSYNAARDVLFTDRGFVESDGMIECLYTGRRVRANGSTAPGGFNTEHSWPQSLGATGTAKSDLHHLFPTDSRANSYRGSHLFDFVTCLEGIGSCSFSQGGSALGRNEEGKTSFEVRQERRGDIARSHFYFSIRYNRRIPKSEEDALRVWDKEDPVDDIERKRNDEIERVQRNRSPFVDRPEFADAIDDF